MANAPPTTGGAFFCRAIFKIALRRQQNDWFRVEEAVQEEQAGQGSGECRLRLTFSAYKGFIRRACQQWQARFLFIRKAICQIAQQNGGSEK